MGFSQIARDTYHFQVTEHYQNYWHQLTICVPLFPKGCRRRGVGGHGPLDFDISVKGFQGADFAHHVNICPPDFHIFRRLSFHYGFTRNPVEIPDPRRAKIGSTQNSMIFILDRLCQILLHNTVLH